ncbi:tRNA-uridine aminocarboxypropyltransferase 2 isoform 4-T4 [Ciconia maguari]
MERGSAAGGSGAAAAPARDEEREEHEGCAGLWELPVEHCERRPECGRCSRPQKVCLCPFLPIHPLKVSTCLYIIQHPAEENRVLRTVPLLAACLPPDKCKILVGRRFSEDRYPELATVCRNPNTLILYPGAEATNLEEVAVMSSSPSVMIIIDGTWSQAKDIFYKNSLFRLPKQFSMWDHFFILWFFSFTWDPLQKSAGPESWNHRAAHVPRDLKRSSGPPFCGKGSLDEIIWHLVWSHLEKLQ